MPNPLEGLQQFNIAGNAQNALLQGMQMGDAIRQRKEQEARKQATTDFYRAKIGGDASQITTATNALAMYDPKTVYDMQGAQQEAATRTAVATGQAPASALAAINWDDYANLSKEQNAIALQNVKTMGQLALMADTPQKWDATIDQLGPQFAQYKGQFGMREAIIARAGEATTFLEQQAPKYQVLPADAMLVNTRDPAALAQVSGGNPPANDLKAQAEAAIAAGADPEKVYARMRELGGGTASNGGETFPGWY